MKTGKRRISLWQWSAALILVLALTGISHHTFAAGGTWTTLAPMLQGTKSSSGGVINGQFYVASGGGAVTMVEAYNPLANSWTAKSPIPIPVNDSGTASGVINGKLYIVAGAAYNQYWVNTLQIYDSATDKWTTGAPIPISNLGMATGGVIDGKLYVAGGETRYWGNTGDGYSLPNLWVYDPATDSWASKAPMSAPRSGAAAGVINGKLYVAGGLGNHVIFNSIEVYDPATDTWTPKAQMPAPKCQCSSAVVNGILYVIGGSDGLGIVNTVYAYDPGSDTWTSCSPIPGASWLSTSGVIGGIIYVAGGGGPNGAASDLLRSFTPEAPNQPPTANAGANVEVATYQLSATVIQGTAADPDNDPLNYRWLEGATVLAGWQPVDAGQAYLSLAGLPLSMGAHTLTLEVSDGKATASSSMILTIDNSAPHAAPSGAGTYEVGVPVEVAGQVSDFDGDRLTYSWKEGNRTCLTGTISATAGGTPVELPPEYLIGLALGPHTISLEVCDGINAPVTQNMAVTIIDTQAPKLAPKVTPTIIWPPDKKMVDVVINANATDNSGLPTIGATVACNEAGCTLGTDWTAPTIDQASGVITLKLRADRYGTGKGRIYTVMVSATDAAGNTTNAAVPVFVPHDQGKN